MGGKRLGKNLQAGGVQEPEFVASFCPTASACQAPPPPSKENKSPQTKQPPKSASRLKRRKLSYLEKIVKVGQVDLLNVSKAGKIIEDIIIFFISCSACFSRKLVSQKLEAKAVSPDGKEILKFANFSEI
jgi:hypothetical protein